MKIVCDAQQLTESIATASTIVPSRSSKGVLMNLALVAKQDFLEILATDLEVSLRLVIKKVEIENEGSVLVNAARITQILKELGDDRIEISSTKTSGCIIKGEGCRFDVFGEDFDNYPTIVPFNPDGAIEIPADDFSDMVSKTQFAAAIEKTRYAMNGIFFKLTKDNLELVATDGKRLSLVSKPFKGKVSKDISAVVPTKAMNTISKLLVAGEEKILINFDTNQVVMKSDEAEVTARLVEGQYPPYEQVIPTDLDKELLLNRSDFNSAIRKASLMTSRESASVRFNFSSENGLELSTRTIDVGESKITIELADYTYQPVATAFNPRYFIEVFKVIDQPIFTLKIKDNNSPVLVEEENGLTYVIMPINLPSED